MELINPKELLKGIAVILIYYIIPSIIAIPFYLLYRDGIIGYSLYMIFVYFSLTLVFVLIYIKDLIYDFKDLKENFDDRLATTLKYWAIGLVVMLVSSFIFGIFNLPSNNNQDANIESFKSYPIAEILCAVVCAPIMEELVFRRGLKKATSNKHLYAITTGLLFGFIHVTSSIHGFKDLIMLLYLVPYGAMGVAFSYIYEKTNNIYYSMFVHAFHNAISLFMVFMSM